MGNFELPRRRGWGRGGSFSEDRAVERQRLFGVVGECVQTRVLAFCICGGERGKAVASKVNNCQLQAPFRGSWFRQLL